LSIAFVFFCRQPSWSTTLSSSSLYRSLDQYFFLFVFLQLLSCSRLVVTRLSLLLSRPIVCRRPTFFSRRRRLRPLFSSYSYNNPLVVILLLLLFLLNNTTLVVITFFFLPSDRRRPICRAPFDVLRSMLEDSYCSPLGNEPKIMIFIIYYIASPSTPLDWYHPPSRVSFLFNCNCCNGCFFNFTPPTPDSDADPESRVTAVRDSQLPHCDRSWRRAK
jgi:hypothetical protein